MGKRDTYQQVMFQSQGRFFFGGYIVIALQTDTIWAVSIAGAILFWGLHNEVLISGRLRMFQSQGRFFFGGYVAEMVGILGDELVSIAGAILFWGLLMNSLILTPFSL